VMNLPNILSLFRLFVTAFFIVFIVLRRFDLALLLFVLQALSDLLDGFLARRMGIKTNLGAYLDPMADKVMLAGSYIVLCFQDIVPLWLLCIILGRDVIISLGFLVLVRKRLKMEPVPSLLSKSTTVFQMLTIVYVLWSVARPFELIFFYITALLTILSGIQYVIAGWSVIFKKEMRKI
jgi:cardiolipin synthase (CMP-forming)